MRTEKNALKLLGAESELFSELSDLESARVCGGGTVLGQGEKLVEKSGKTTVKYTEAEYKIAADAYFGLVRGTV
ncbi:hypothetical protein [Nostoc sp.]|uniref:hypothetical protein n=1 Tax=Nostoc sp. TaxID=1180 RepID=UPI002FF5627E